jgi:hypothetical protein
LNVFFNLIKKNVLVDSVMTIFQQLLYFGRSMCSLPSWLTLSGCVAHSGGCTSRGAYPVYSHQLARHADDRGCFQLLEQCVGRGARQYADSCFSRLCNSLDEILEKIGTPEVYTTLGKILELQNLTAKQLTSTMTFIQQLCAFRMFQRLSFD